MQAFLDFLPVIAFVGTYWVTKDMSMAITVIMVAVTLQLAATWFIKREVNKMLLASAVMVVVFGGISLFMDDPIFFKWKPTGLYWIFAGVFLGSQFIGEKPVVQRMMTSIASEEFKIPDNVWRQLNLAWVGFFIFAGVANIYVAYNYEEAVWVNFKLFGLMALTFIFLVIQSLWLSKYMDDEEPGTPEKED